MTSNHVLLAIGANQSGAFGPPLESLRKGCALLDEMGISITSRSSLFGTAPSSNSPQPRYLNAALLAVFSMSALQLLRACKRIERMAGRRKLSGTNGPRPMDIDIVGIGGLVIGWPARQSCNFSIAARRGSGRRRSPRGNLVVPHPLMHERRFVLEPLAEIAPHWVHPVLGMTTLQLLSHVPRMHEDVQRVLDSSWLSCDK